MASLIESPQVAFVSGSKLPASSPLSLSRLILPFLGVAIGVSVGSATGLTLALVNAPNDTVAASSDSVQASHAANGPSAPAIQPTADTVQSNAKAANPSLSIANPVAKAHTPTTVQLALNKTPDAVKPAMFRLGGKEWHVARPVATSVIQPVRQRSVSAPPAAPTAIDTAQSGLDAGAKTASLYTEGDLTVADYDVTAGTLLASDGRTFVLGTTIAASYATSWDSYHFLVHYRCDQAGSCVLMRAGAVAPNARLI